MQSAEMAISQITVATKARRYLSGLIAGQWSWRTLNLRGKAIAAFLALMVYITVLTGYVLYENAGLHDQFRVLQTMHDVEQSLRALRIASYHTLLAAYDAEKMREVIGMEGNRFQNVRLDFALIDSNFNSLKQRLAPDTPHFSRIASVVAQIHIAFDGGDMLRLIPQIKDLITESEALSLEQRQALEQVTISFQQRSERLASTLVLHTVIGLGLFGLAAWIFFSHLALDFGRVRQRAIELSKGNLGEPLELTRHDEVGDLMVAVNQMAVDLDRRERELGLEREKTFHQEKMAAIGTLAAGIAHEIGNPITAISGIAQQMCDAKEGPLCMAQGSHCRPEMILEQIERVAKITREITEFALPRSAQHDWLDLNELIRSTVSLMRYDHRFRNIEVVLNLDGQLPAIMGVSDQLTQVLMNLIINAADAVAEIETRSPSITVSSQPEGENVILRVSDNGPGMDRLTQTRATEAFYTTKAPGKGTGLGLTVCASIVEDHGGLMIITSTPGEGTTASVILPIQGNKENTA